MGSDRARTAAPRRRRPGAGHRHRGLGPLAALGVLVALNLAMVAAVAAPARSQDDAPDDATVSDAEAENPEEPDSEPSDAPAPDGPEGNELPDAPPDGVLDDEASPPADEPEPGLVAVAGGWRPRTAPDWPLALVPPVPLVGVVSLEALLGTDVPECPPRPFSPFIDADPYPGGWCREHLYWIVEVTCGPQHAGAGLTVRFNADPGVVGDLTLDDVCGGVDRVGVCRAAGREAPRTESETETASGTEEAPDGTAVADACAPLWPPGAWYQYSRRDPVTGSTTSGGSHTGSWLGSRHPAAAAVPSFELRCTGGRLEARVHTGGALAGSRVRGIPVDYRIGGSLRFQEWAPAGAAAGSSPAVSLPPLFAADFAGLLAANPSGEFLFRPYGPDGAALGTAAFDLAAVGEMVRPLREHCPALPAAPTDSGSEAAPVQQDGG